MPQRQEVERQLPSADAQLSVMVVDDDDLTRDGLYALLNSDGNRVISCASAQCALDRLRSAAPPDIILLDLIMPGMNGWEFRVEQKKEPKWASIPIIAVSGDLSAKAQAIDATAYLSKPIDGRSLLDTVRRVGRDLRQSRSLARDSEFQRLVSLGSLLGGIAHEINNPLAFMEGSLELLQRQLLALSGPGRTVEPFALANALHAVERTRVGVQRITDVVQCVSMFAWADPTFTEALDVHLLLESSLQVAANEIRHCATLERAYRAVPHVHGSSAKLGQVFLNLIQNALFEIQESGHHQHTLRVLTAQEGDFVEVTIEDTASMHDGSSIRCLFDPLTTVTSGRLGLHFGLAVSREVVEGMGGSIEVQRLLPRGARFRISLPRCTEAAFPPPPSRAPTTAPAKRFAVAIIDDNPLMCEVLATMLAEDYTVAAFTSPRIALASALGGKFDLILCDLMMPDLNGMDLFERLTSERPDLSKRFIFITGGAFTERARSFLRQSGRPTVQKPFSRKVLLDTLRTTLIAARLQGVPESRAELPPTKG